MEFENQIRSIDWSERIQLSEDTKQNAELMINSIVTNQVIEILSLYHEWFSL